MITEKEDAHAMRITIDAGKTVDTAIYALYEGIRIFFPSVN